MSATTPRAYAGFLASYPQAPEARAAQQRIDELRAIERDWLQAQDADTLEGYDAFILKHPAAREAPEACRRLIALSRPEDHVPKGFLGLIDERRRSLDFVMPFFRVRESHWAPLGHAVTYFLVQIAPGELVRVSGLGTFDRFTAEDLASDTALRYLPPFALCEVYVAPYELVDQDVPRYFKQRFFDVVDLREAAPELPAIDPWKTGALYWGFGVSGGGLTSALLRPLAGAERWIEGLRSQDWEVRRGSLMVLDALDHPRTHELAEPLLDDPIPAVCDAAIRVRRKKREADPISTPSARSCSPATPSGAGGRSRRSPRSRATARWS